MNRWLILTALLWVAALGADDSSGRFATSAVKHGEYRTWHTNGQLAEVRNFANGREEGLQQSWTPDGVLFLNYEVRNGRRYGLANARPCEPAEQKAGQS